VASKITKTQKTILKQQKKTAKKHVFTSLADDVCLINVYVILLLLLSVRLIVEEALCVVAIMHS